MTDETQAPPKGYLKAANGSLVPESKVKDIDKIRSKFCEDLCKEAKKVQATLLAFRLTAMESVAEFVERSGADYGVNMGGKKGNVTLISFDGRYKVVRQIQERIDFGEQLLVAKSLIDECIIDWSRGSKAEIKVIVNQAFEMDKEGKVSPARVLGLRKVDIVDERWQRAMKAISDSMQISGSKPYLRCYERNDAGEYIAIVLDVAGV